MTNYGWCLAHTALHFQCDLLVLDDEAVLDYLHLLKTQKHTVYGLRDLYRIYNRMESKVILPSIERQKALPVVLGQSEVKFLIKSAKLLKHRLVISLLYGCGLRNQELCNLKITDLDLDRKRLQLHVRRGKYRKDRYLPLCDLLIRGVKRYLASEAPVGYLFNRKSRTWEYITLTPRSVQWAIREARSKSGIRK